MPDQPSSTADEATAIATIGHALEQLDRDSRLRVLDLLIDRFYTPIDRQAR